MADLSQILQSGLMNYGQPNALDRGLMSGDPSMQLGMQLLANSNTPGNFAGIFGRSMLGTQEAQQKNAAQQLALMQQGIGTQQAVQMFPYLQQAMAQAFGQPGAQGQPAQGGQGGGQDPNAQPGAPGVPTSPTVAAQSPGGSPASMANLGAILGLMGRPGGQQLIDAAKFQTENDPAHATTMAAAKGEIAQDQQILQQAIQTGNKPIAQAAYTKLLKDTGMLNVGQFNGDVTTFGGITPQALGMSNFNPQTGKQIVNGVQSPIPGAPATTAAMAGAEAQGKATGELTEVTDAAGNKYRVPVSTLLGGGGAGAPATGKPTAKAASRSGPPANMSGIGPGQTEIIKAGAQQAAEDNKGFKSDLESGKDMLTNTAELRRAASDFTPNGFAETRTKWLDTLNSLGLLTDQEKKELGSAQVGNKIAIQLQAAATKQLGSREAAQIFSIMGKSLPNLTMSADGLEKVSGYLDGIARYKIARAQVAQNRMNANDIQGVNNVRGEFVSNTNPLYYILASTAPKQRQEIIQSMGDKAPAFLAQWNKAANAKWAPRPNDYQGSDGGAGP